MLLFAGLTGTWQGALVGLASVVAYVLVVLPFSADGILLAAGARRADPSQPEEAALVHLVARLSSAAGMDPPRVFIEPSENVNAFAVGLTPRRSAICVTSAALRAFDEEELAGVVGHELAHVRNRDTLVKTVAFGVVGALGLLAAALAAFAFVVLSAPVEGRDEKERAVGWAVKLSVAAGLLILAAIAFFFLWLARLGYFAISRNREYLADATSAELNGGAEGIRHALQKLTWLPRLPSRREAAMASLYVAPPGPPGLTGLLDTHPPLEKRIARLERGEATKRNPP